MDSEEENGRMEEQQTDEKIDIAAVLNAGKTEEQEQIAAMEFHNCIILNGDGDIHAIFNEGIIDGDIRQGVTENSESRPTIDKAIYHFDDRLDIQKFIRNYRDEREFLIFVSVAFLECIPDFLWSDITMALSNALRTVCGDRSEHFQSPYRSLQDNLEWMHMVSVSAECRTNLGKTKTSCIMFSEDRIREKVEKELWEYDYSLKNAILSWLLKLKNNKKISETMSYQIVMAFSRIAVYDWSFVQNNLFQALLLKKGNRNRNYMVRVLSYVLKYSSYNALLDRQIQGWIDGKDTFLWEIVYRLYGINEEYRFNGRIEERLEAFFVEDMDWRCLGEGIYHSKWNVKVDIYPAYYNEKLRNLMIMILVKQYEECESYKQKENLADYFIWLLTNDYKMEGYPNYKLLYIDAFNQRAIRLNARNMYWDFWKRYRVRKIWMQILHNHFKELEYAGKSGDYLKEFFKTMAFTGDENDYKTVKQCLENMRGTNQIAKELEQYLVQMLQRRRDL